MSNENHSYHLWRKKLAWRAKRGSLELNLVLMAFLLQHDQDVSSSLKTSFSERQKFEVFLDDHSDQTLWEWLVLGSFKDSDQQTINYCNDISELARQYMLTHPLS